MLKKRINTNKKMRILFFIESLHAGGKERRLVELLSYLKNNPKLELFLVLTKHDIHYKIFLKLGIPYVILERESLVKNLQIFYKFYKICKSFNPDIIHTWGNIVSFYSLPTVILQKIFLVNSQISNAPRKISKCSKLYIMSKINFAFSKLILSNSVAGLKSYNIKTKKGKVIYNGFDLRRFKNLPDKNKVKLKYEITTPYLLIMVASFSEMKDYNKYIDVAKEISSIRKDVTFLAVGSGIYLEKMKNRVQNEHIPNVSFTGKLDYVEPLISISDIGILFSPNGEGISNSIMEYMALEKPVIASDSGGTKEIVKHDVIGYLITNESPRKIAELIDGLLNNSKKRLKMGRTGGKLIMESFTIDRMGREFEDVYFKLIGAKNLL